jgi:hypothetical protein
MKKLKWVIGLAVVFLLILTTNLLDRKEFKIINESVRTIYNDQMVAQDLIFKMSLLLEQKSVAVASGDATFFAIRNNEINRELNQLIEQFKQTKLTNPEEESLLDFSSHLRNLIETEQQFITKDQDALTQQARILMVSPIADLSRELYVLSKIQMKEGKEEMRRSTESANKVTSLANLEIIFLILIGIIIQIIILMPTRKLEEYPYPIN